LIPGKCFVKTYTKEDFITLLEDFSLHHVGENEEIIEAGETLTYKKYYGCIYILIKPYPIKASVKNLEISITKRNAEGEYLTPDSPIPTMTDTGYLYIPSAFLRESDYFRIIITNKKINKKKEYYLVQE